MESNRARTVIAVALAVGAVVLLTIVAFGPDAPARSGPAENPIGVASPAEPLGDPALYAKQGRQMGREGKFDEAMEQYRLAMQVDPADHWNWCMVACVLAYKEDTAGHAAHCREMLARFQQDNRSYVVERVVKSALLLALADAELEQCQAMADMALGWELEPTQAPWVHLAKGMAEYRAGRFEKSVEWLTKARTSSELRWPVGYICADYFLAMGQARLGKMDEARAAMAAAEEELNAVMPGDTPGASGAAIDHWLISRIAQREAKKVVGGR